ncbi:MAG TPA: HupE/UreJ family protein [Tepidisphaeraceae bacterium]|nr:HupE/UreJ family protein [Tepidisphaeraceae bacterium]
MSHRIAPIGVVPLLGIAFMLMNASPAWAHPEGFSGLRAQVQAGRVHVVMTVHTRDMSAWFPPAQYPNYVADVCRAMTNDCREIVAVQFDGTAVDVTGVRVFSPEVGMIELDADYPLSSSAKTVLVWSKCLPRLPSGHQQLLFIEDARGSAIQTVAEDTLTPDHDSAEADLPVVKAQSSTTSPSVASSHESSSSGKRISFFLLGIDHIVTGYDHLLFLAALLLVCNSFREAASVITFFTVAHSITLSLAALNLVRIPPQIVEPAIAASIVYVGLENIFGKHRFGWRAAITFGFGLVHGLGFAAALRDVGLGSTSVGVAMPLLKFSIGLETGQLCIAALMLKILLTLRNKSPQYKRQWVPAGSALVSLIGAYWLIVRVMAG